MMKTISLRRCASPIGAALLVSTLGLLPFTASMAQSETATEGGSAEHKFELAQSYYGECQNTDDERFEQIRPYLKAFTDMEVMADMMADPAKFAALMSVVNDPRTIHVMSKCATEPVMWNTWMNGLTDFNKMSRAMMRFMNPNMYLSWMMAPMNPAMYQPMMQFMDPAYYTRWMTAMANPMFYQPITSMADPNWYTPRFNWMMNPQSMQPLFGMMNFGMPVAPFSAAPSPGDATGPATDGESTGDGNTQ